MPERLASPARALLPMLIGGAAASLSAQADWHTPLVVPKPRAVHAAAFDLLRGEAILFGGNASSGVQGDTWRWTPSAGWTNLRPNVAPSARREHAMAYDPVRGEIVLYSGWDGTSVVGDTWLWNGTSWRQATPANTPSARMSELAWDPVGQQILLFGGQDGPGVRWSDTWAWNGVDWQQLSPSNVPPPRFDHAMVTDWARGEVLMHGGWDNAFLGDTWRWNGSDWQPAPSGPTPRSEHKMANVAGSILLFGGDSSAGRQQDTWLWNGASWTQQTPTTSPGPREEHVLIDGTTVGSAMLFGGWHSVVGHLADQWTFASGQWQLDTPSQPIGTGTGAMDHDPVAGRSILFGGFQDQQTSAQTWSYAGGIWTRLFPTNSPALRAEPALAFDRARGEFVLFGGVTGTTYYNDTWVFSGNTWQQRQPATLPPARWGHAMCYDGARGTVLLFSGRLGGASTTLTDTWEWNGTNWSQLFPTTVPRGREDHSMAFDSDRGETIMFGGWITGATFTNETWAFRNGNWVLLAPANAPTPRSEQMMAYDRARRRIVMFGGDSSAGRLGDTWEFTTNWVQRSPANAPAPREEGCMVFDEQSQEIVLAVGWDLGHYTDTWHFGTRPAATAIAYGSGCQGNAPALPALTATRPWLGSAVQVSTTGVPGGSFAMLVLGFGRDSTPLGSQGMPGCTLLAQPMVTELMTTTGNSAQLSLGLPANPIHIGTLLDLQAFVFAPGANPIGVVNSNGVELRAALP